MQPFKVFGQAIGIWVRQFVPLVALSSLSLFFGRMLVVSRSMFSSSPANAMAVALSVLYIFEILAVLVLHAFVGLLIINHVRQHVGGAASFRRAFRETGHGLAGYLEVLLVLVVFAAVMLGIGGTSLVVGQNMIVGKGASGVNTAVLLATSTVFVVLVIALCWYVFFFSLAPLIAAYEKKGPWQCLSESRRRVKKAPGAYLALLLGVIAVYFTVGLTMLAFLRQVWPNRYALNVLDPLLVTVFFRPLGLTLWFLSYQKLSEVKAS